MKKTDIGLSILAVGFAFAFGGFGTYAGVENYDVKTQSHTIPARLRGFSEGYEMGVLALGYAFIGLLLGLIPLVALKLIDFFVVSPCKTIHADYKKAKRLTIDEIEIDSDSDEESTPLSWQLHLKPSIFNDRYILLLCGFAAGVDAIFTGFGAYAAHQNKDLLMASQSLNMPEWARQFSNRLLQGTITIGYGAVPATPIVIFGFLLKTILHCANSIVRKCLSLDLDETQYDVILLRQFQALNTSAKINVAFTALCTLLGLSAGIYFGYENYDWHEQSIHMGEDTRKVSEVLQQGVLALGEAALAGLGAASVGTLAKIVVEGLGALVNRTCPRLNPFHSCSAG